MATKGEPEPHGTGAKTPPTRPREVRPGPGEEAAGVCSAVRPGAAPAALPSPAPALPQPPPSPPAAGASGFRGEPEGGRGRHVRAARGPVGPQAGEGPRAPRAGAGVGPGSAAPDSLEGGPRTERAGGRRAPAAAGRRRGAGFAHAVAPADPGRPVPAAQRPRGRWRGRRPGRP